MNTAQQNDSIRFGVINRFFGSSTPPPPGSTLVYGQGIQEMTATERQGLMEAVKRFVDFDADSDHARGELEFQAKRFSFEVGARGLLVRLAA